MQTSLSYITKKFFNPETLIPFLIGSLVLSIFSNSISKILENTIGGTTQAQIKILMGALVIFLFCVWWLSELLRVTSPVISLGKAQPCPHKGLILLVSREEPCRKAIKFHLPKLEYCWLICSTQSQDIAQNIKDEFSSNSLLKFPEPLIVNDVYEPLEFSKVVEKIYLNLPKSLREQDVICDFTGMTAQASVGMVLTSLFIKTKLQYTPAEIADGKLTGRSLEPIEITLKEQLKARKTNP